MMGKLLLASICLLLGVASARHRSYSGATSRDDQIAAACDVKQQCARYAAESKNKKILITLLYESLCPGCQKFITEELYPKIWKYFRDYVTIELVPYGNAKIKDGEIVCQHGAEECRINQLEGCMLEHAPQPLQVPLIYCIENQLKVGTTIDKAVNKCFRTLNVTQDVILAVQSCQVTHEGHQLQVAAAQRTQAVWPQQHDHVPWVLFQNVSLGPFQNQIEDIPNLICQWYQGDKPPSNCGGIQHDRVKKLTVCKKH